MFMFFYKKKINTIKTIFVKDIFMNFFFLKKVQSSKSKKRGVKITWANAIPIRPKLEPKAHSIYPLVYASCTSQLYVSGQNCP